MFYLAIYEPLFYLNLKDHCDSNNDGKIKFFWILTSVRILRMTVMIFLLLFFLMSIAKLFTKKALIMNDNNQELPLRSRVLLVWIIVMTVLQLLLTFFECLLPILTNPENNGINQWLNVIYYLIMPIQDLLITTTFFLLHIFVVRGISLFNPQKKRLAKKKE